MSDTTHLESIRAVGAGALGERMGIEITEATPERLVGTMPVEGNTQPYGLLHGGASVLRLSGRSARPWWQARTAWPSGSTSTRRTTGRRVRGS